jgi:hypothetical protein
MKAWPRNPVIYEINTWVWLGDLGRKYRRIVDLATVPEQEWDAIASHRFDAVWFMGVWERRLLAGSETGKGMMDAYERLLGDSLRGDPTLFARADEVEAAWRVVDPLLAVATPVHEYAPGTWGPPEADALAPPGGWRVPKTSV